MTTAAELFVLQRTDLAFDSTVVRLAEVEAHLGETEELIGARERVDQCREEVREIQARKKELDFQADEARGKATEIESKLYGGTVKNPKELEDFEADLTSLRGQLGKREDALLEAMLELEEGEVAQKGAEGALAEIETSWKAEQVSLRETQATLKQDRKSTRLNSSH